MTCTRYGYTQIFIDSISPRTFSQNHEVRSVSTFLYYTTKEVKRK
nr:MAG TPA: hypothetical protein [Caudoviricetes sp.]